MKTLLLKLKMFFLKRSESEIISDRLNEYHYLNFHRNDAEKALIEEIKIKESVSKKN